MHRLLSRVSIAAALGLLVGRAAPGADSSQPPRILTSFLPVHSLALSVAGTRAPVQNWLPPGVDPHDFQFSPRDLRRLREADLLIVGGLGLEGWTEPKLRGMSGNPALRVTEASARLPQNQLIHDPCGHDHGESDPPGHSDHPLNPHFWLDPLLAAHAVTNILEALRAMDPAGADVYSANAAATVARLLSLHREFEQGLEGCAATPFLTYHNAFPYLARRYRLRLIGVVEVDAEQSPSARQLAELSRLARAEGARVLFVDGPPTRLARQLAADLQLQLASLETLETGELGPRAYEEGMRRNLAVLRASLRPAATR